MLEELQNLVATGFSRAGEQLSALLGRRIELTAPEVALLPLHEAMASFGAADGDGVAILTAFAGDLSGQALLLLERERAEHLAGLCFGEDAPPDPRLVDSALSEVGNIASASCLNTLADRFGLCVTISPPEVVGDMVGAILGTLLPLVEVLPDRVVVARTEFRESGVDVSGSFLLLPDGDALERLEGLSRHAAGG